MKHKNNAGFSLIELIVVIAILGACVSLVTLSLSTIFSSQAKKCATSIDALLSSTKLNAMSKEDGVYLRLYINGDGEVAADYHEKNAPMSTEVLGNSKCSVSYTVGGTVKSLDSTGINITFVRGTGSFDFSKNASWNGSKCNAITVSGGGRSYTITLVPATGAHTMGVTS